MVTFHFTCNPTETEVHGDVLVNKCITTEEKYLSYANICCMVLLAWIICIAIKPTQGKIYHQYVTCVNRVHTCMGYYLAL